MMKLKKLLKEIPNIEVKGSKELSITGITANSKGVAPGNLFIAKKGKTYDGGHYIPDAIQAGASLLSPIYMILHLKKSPRSSIPMWARSKAIWLIILRSSLSRAC